MSVRRRVLRLERLRPPPPPPSPQEFRRSKQWQQITQRLTRIVDKALPLLSAEQQEQVVQGLDGIGGDKPGPYSAWLDHLLDGRCRLPELGPEAGKALLLAWLSPEADGGMVCRQCGLEYPRHRHPPMSDWKVLPGKTPLQGSPPWYELPEFFPACPNCGASRYEVDWPHLVQDACCPWMTLDGYIGAAS